LPQPKLEALFKRAPKLGGAAADRAALRRRLESVAKQGHATIQALLNPQLVAVAVPICDRDGQTMAALNVTSYTTPLSRAAVNSKFLQPLSDTKSQIEAALRSSDAIPLASGNFMSG
jgi:IclR family pca regulon transcriptional regulator